LVRKCNDDDDDSIMTDNGIRVCLDLSQTLSKQRSTGLFSFCVIVCEASGVPSSRALKDFKDPSGYQKNECGCG